MKAVLLDFFPGHGGDFLSTLYGCCNNDCMSTNTSKWHDESSFIINRMSEANPKMPGANWGTKILYIENDQDFEAWKQKAEELKFEWDETKQIVTFGTHSDAQDNPLAYDLIKKFYNITPSIVMPIPTTPESAAWINCYDSNHRQKHQYVGPFQAMAKMMRRYKRYKEMNAKLVKVDHIDLVLNEPDKLIEFCSTITTSDMNKDLQNFVYESYVPRISRFKQWWRRWAYREKFKEDFQSTVDKLVK